MTKFNLGESILGYHGPLLYIAKVLQVDVSGDKEMYFIHYQKWSKK